MNLDITISSEESNGREGCENCVRLQAECERLKSVLAEAKKELMGWHMAGDPRPRHLLDQPWDWDKIDEYYDAFEREWESKYL